VSAGLDEALRILREGCGDRVRTRVPLAPLTTFRVGGPAAVYLEAEDEDDLSTVSRAIGETTIPGGRYLRLRLIGDAPGVYGQIAAAFDELFKHANHDPTRPLIEFYRREGEVDCLVPVNAAATV